MIDSIINASSVKNLGILFNIFNVKWRESAQDVVRYGLGGNGPLQIFSNKNISILIGINCNNFVQ